jgi:hypothetical protein
MTGLILSWKTVEVPQEDLPEAMGPVMEVELSCVAQGSSLTDEARRSTTPVTPVSPVPILSQT